MYCVMDNNLRTGAESEAQRIAADVTGIDQAIKDYIKAYKNRLKLSETLRLTKQYCGRKSPCYILYFGNTWIVTATTYKEAIKLRRALWEDATK